MKRVAKFTNRVIILLGEVVKRGKGAVGVNWGTLSHHRLSAKTVVDLLKLNKISKVKIFDTDPGVLNALRGSKLQVMVGIHNDFLSIFTANLFTCCLCCARQRKQGR